METLDLETIRDGFPGLTPVFGEFLLEGCVVSLTRWKHHSGVLLQVNGDITEKFQTIWKKEITPQIERAWEQETATERAAECIGLLLVSRLFENTPIERARRKSGIDYWLGETVDDDAIFHKKERLEIAGMFSGTASEIKRKIQSKFVQTSKSDHSDLPAIIVVVELRTPQAFLRRKK